MENRFKTIFCSECNIDIPIEELEEGAILVHCPKCTGECLTCECHLVSECFSDTPNVKVIHSKKSESNNIKDKEL